MLPACGIIRVAAWSSNPDTLRQIILPFVNLWGYLQLACGSSSPNLVPFSVNAISKIAEYADLPDGWDGYGGKAPDTDTFVDARDFIERLPSTFPAPQPMIGGSGVIGFYWEGNGCYASVELDGSGSYCYIADTLEQESGEDAISTRGPFPQRLSQAIMATADVS
jgi:hypothetical protein